VRIDHISSALEIRNGKLKVGLDPRENFLTSRHTR
jgi:hypothetical protein